MARRLHIQPGQEAIHDVTERVDNTATNYRVTAWAVGDNAPYRYNVDYNETFMVDYQVEHSHNISEYYDTKEQAMMRFWDWQSWCDGFKK